MKKWIYKAIFSIVLLLFAFVSVFKIPIIKVNALDEEEDKFIYLQYGLLVNGLYYNQYTSDYMWVSSEDVLDSTQIELITDFENYVYTITEYFEYFRISYDIYQINPYGQQFVNWWGDYFPYIDKLREAGYFFYLVQGGVNVPPVSISKVLKIKIGNEVIPIFPVERIADIVDFIDYLKEESINAGDLLAEYNKGYNRGYEKGKEDGIIEGRQGAYQEGYDNGYQNGYNKGLSEQLDDKDFTVLLKSAFLAIGTFLGINLIPGVSIGAIIAVPIVFGIISFIIGKRKD